MFLLHYCLHKGPSSSQISTEQDLPHAAVKAANLLNVWLFEKTSENVQKGQIRSQKGQLEACGANRDILSVKAVSLVL